MGMPANAVCVKTITKNSEGGTAEGGNRTLTPLRERDFESRASANSATSAEACNILPHPKENAIRRPNLGPKVRGAPQIKGLCCRIAQVFRLSGQVGGLS